MSKKSKELHRRNLRTALVLLTLTSAVALSIFYVRTRHPVNDSTVIRPYASSDVAIEPAAEAPPPTLQPEAPLTEPAVQ
jgi:hypothetical protein